MTIYSETKCYVFSPFLTVESDRMLKGFKFGSFELASIYEVFSEKSHGISVEVVERDGRHFEEVLRSGDYRQQFYGFFAEREGRISVFRRRFFGRKNGYVLLDFGEDEVRVEYSKEYLRWAELRVASLPSLGTLLTDVAYVAGLNKGKVALHGAALEKNGNGVLVIGLPDTGKTYSTFRLMDSGYHFMSDDIAYIDCRTKILASVPYTRTVDRGGLLPRIIRLKSYLWKNSSAGRDSIMALENPKVTATADLKTIVFIERGPEKLSELDLDLALERLLGSNRMEFRYFSNPLLNSYGYFFSQYSHDCLMRLEKHQLASAIGGTIKCYLVQREHPDEFSVAIRDLHEA